MSNDRIIIGRSSERQFICSDLSHFTFPHFTIFYHFPLTIPLYIIFPPNFKSFKTNIFCLELSLSLTFLVLAVDWLSLRRAKNSWRLICRTVLKSVDLKGFQGRVLRLKIVLGQMATATNPVAPTYNGVM